MNALPNPQLQLAFDFVQHTNTNVFLTGKAGTGKTTFLHNLKKISPKRMIVVAPTGVAAINAGGVTIHSFFQLPFGPYIPNQNSDTYGEKSKRQNSFRFHRDKINIIKSLDLLVIDEISMVRADLLDGVDVVLRKYKNQYKPFGGVQLLMIGDLQQLAPVIKNDEWEILKNYYKTQFFFGSRALAETNYITIELKHIYRQSDKIFIELLNKIRDNKANDEDLHKLNERYIRDFYPNTDEGYITLTTHNAQAQQINDSRLSDLDEKSHIFKAAVQGEFPEYSYPTEFELKLKKGAQVMFVKNDSSAEKVYFNGKIGKITSIDDEMIYVKCPGDHEIISTGRAEWQNTKYAINEETKEIEETVAGTFTQYPLKLAWAITIHKSQGLTFDKAIIDANDAFAFGQVYVALSRCRTIEGLVLSSPITKKCIITNETVASFVHQIEKNPPQNEHLEESKKEYQKSLIFELFEFTALQRRIFYLLKILNENSTVVFGNVFDSVNKINDLFKTEIIQVAEKFHGHLFHLISKQFSIEENEFLQERIKKASVYFEEKLTEVSSVTDNLNFETDNRTIRKHIREIINKFSEELQIKISCLNAGKSGFSVKKHLETRAKGAIETEKPARRVKEPEETFDGPIPHPFLYSRIKKWRSKKAEEIGLPFYMILPEKTIIQLVIFLPVFQVQLLDIKGFGKKKIKNFGKEIVDIIKNYCEEKNINIPQNEPDLKDFEEELKKEKADTKQISYEQFKSGKTVEEIAAEREMAVTTIEGHLAHYVGAGELEIDQFVSSENIKLISDYYNKNGYERLKPAKEALGESVSWSDLRFVMMHLEHLGKLRKS